MEISFMICLLLPYPYRFFGCSSLYQRIEKCPSQLPTLHVFLAPMAEADLAYFARSCESQAVLAVEKVHIKGIKTYPPCHHNCFYEISFFVSLWMETGLLARFKKCLHKKIHLITDQLVFYLLHLNVLKGWCINKFYLSFRKILVNLISSLVFYLFTIKPHTVRYTAVKSVQIFWK